MLQYYFDKKSETCKELLYGGCDDGNTNKFRTLYDCNQQCVQRGAGYRPSRPSTLTHKLPLGRPLGGI